MKRSLKLVCVAVCAFWVVGGRPAHGQDPAGPDPIFEKPAPMTMAKLDAWKVDGVRAVEVTDYAYPGYKGRFAPCPPHADLNPQKAVIVLWGKHAGRFVFQHEASYCPWMQLPNGMSLVNQFFEGNDGWAELFNDPGRRERQQFRRYCAKRPEPGLGAMELFLRQQGRRFASGVARHGGFHRLSQRLGVAAF